MSPFKHTRILPELCDPKAIYQENEETKKLFSQLNIIIKYIQYIKNKKFNIFSCL